MSLMTGCHTSYEVCGLKFNQVEDTLNEKKSHTSYEVCGLKSFGQYIENMAIGSHLVWGVWIEILSRFTFPQDGTSHTSYEVCGLKFIENVQLTDEWKVTPRMRCVDWNI